MNTNKPEQMRANELLAKIGIDNPRTMSSADDVNSLWTDMHEDVGEKLRLRFAQFQQATVFKLGDLVTWKPGMSNKIYPKPGKPAVVVQVLETPRMDQVREAGSPYFCEPLNLVLGFMLEEGAHSGDFILCHFDGRRFTHWKPNH